MNKRSEDSYPHDSSQLQTLWLFLKEENIDTYIDIDIDGQKSCFLLCANFIQLLFPEDLFFVPGTVLDTACMRQAKRHRVYGLVEGT